jgi:hypothetical protein
MSALILADIIEGEKEWKKKWEKGREERYKRWLEMQKKYKKTEGSVMKGRTDIKRNKEGKRVVESEVNIRDGLTDKEKSAIKKSFVATLNKKLAGKGLEIDLSSDEDEPKIRPLKGRNILYDSDSSSSDDEKIRTYNKILKHLESHVGDPKEKIDPRDFTQSKMIIDKIETIKKKRGRPKKEKK